MKYSFMGVPDFRRIIDENANASTPAMLVTSHGDAGVLLDLGGVNKVHHTPGPWNLKAGSALTIASSAGDIAYLCGCQGAEIRPNAILIAAAPTLLEAAREALRMVRNCPGNWENGVREMLERAIAIATEVR